MKHPLVSIVLPTHNGSRYLRQSISSCINQTYPNCELVIVDDASTDETPAIIREFVDADTRVRSIRNECHRSLPASLNAGFRESQGEYLTWTSDDNYYAVEAIAEMVAHLSDSPAAGIVYADYTKVDEAGEHVEDVRLGGPEMLAIGNVVRSCFLYRRAVLETVGEYRSDLFTAEDYDYWLRCSAHFRLVHLAKPLYFYRIHEASLTMRFPEKIRLMTERALRENLPRIGWFPRSMRARGYLRLSDLNLLRGNRWGARRFLLAALRHDRHQVLKQKTAHGLWSLLLGRFAADALLRLGLLQVKGQIAGPPHSEGTIPTLR